MLRETLDRANEIISTVGKLKGDLRLYKYLDKYDYRLAMFDKEAEDHESERPVEEIIFTEEDALSLLDKLKAETEEKIRILEEEFSKL